MQKITKNRGINRDKHRRSNCTAKRYSILECNISLSACWPQYSHGKLTSRYFDEGYCCYSAAVSRNICVEIILRCFGTEIVARANCRGIFARMQFYARGRDANLRVINKRRLKAAAIVEFNRRVMRLSRNFYSIDYQRAIMTRIYV